MKLRNHGDPVSSEARSAVELVNRMLRPNVLHEGLRSGLFLVRPPDADRWRAFSGTLVAELKRLGAVAISTDLMELGACSAAALHDEQHGLFFRRTGAVLRSQAERQPASSAATLRQVIKSITDLSRGDTVLILNHASPLTVISPTSAFMRNLGCSRSGNPSRRSGSSNTTV